MLISVTPNFTQICEASLGDVPVEGVGRVAAAAVRGGGLALRALRARRALLVAAVLVVAVEQLDGAPDVLAGRAQRRVVVQRTCTEMLRTFYLLSIY